MTGIKSRLDKLEELQQPEDFTPLFVATEVVPGRYNLDDSRELSEAELDALPSSGHGLAGLMVCLPPEDHEH